MKESTELLYFGKVEIDENLVEHDYQIYCKVDDNLIEFNLNYEPQSVSVSDLKNLNIFLENLEDHINDARAEIFSNFMKGGVSKDFVKIHIDLLPSDGKELLEQTFAKGMTLWEFFLQEIELDHIFIFPDNNEEYIKLCFRISEELTDEILFVRLGKNLKCEEIDIEY